MDGLQGDVTMLVDESLDCPEYNKDNFQMAEEFSFWVEGVFQVRNIYLSIQLTQFGRTWADFSCG